jgi:hypothetical protein
MASHVEELSGIKPLTLLVANEEGSHLSPELPYCGVKLRDTDGWAGEGPPVNAEDIPV